MPSREKTGKTSTSSTTTNSWNVNVLFHNLLQHRPGHDRGHFHQLFHQLRLANCRSQGDVLRHDLGHFDNLIGIRKERIEELEHVLQLFHRLRQRIIEQRHQRDCVDNRLHGALQNLCLRASHLRQRRWPPPRGVFVKQLEEHRVLPGVDRLLAPWSVVRLGPCTSERRVVQGCGQLHAHGHPLVSKPRAEPALPPPPCGACGDAFSNRAIRWVMNHDGNTGRKRVLKSNACVVVVVVVAVVVLTTL